MKTLQTLLVFHQKLLYINYSYFFSSIHCLYLQTGQNKFGQGFLDYLDSIIFASDDFVNVSVQTGNAILHIYFTSAPEKFSKVLLLSNLKSYTTGNTYFKY